MTFTWVCTFLLIAHKPDSPYSVVIGRMIRWIGFHEQRDQKGEYLTMLLLKNVITSSSREAYRRHVLECIKDFTGIMLSWPQRDEHTSAFVTAFFFSSSNRKSPKCDFILKVCCQLQTLYHISQIVSFETCMPTTPCYSLAEGMWNRSVRSEKCPEEEEEGGGGREFGSARFQSSNSFHGCLTRRKNPTPNTQPQTCGGHRGL